MIGISVRGRFLDLPIGATADIERNTPLILGNQVQGELTMPFVLPWTENNLGVLGFITETGKVKTEYEVKQEAVYWEHETLMYVGTLVIESISADLNTPENGQINTYFLIAISNFNSKAEKVNLTDLDLGGERIINGFVEHVKATWSGTQNDFDYVFAPVCNDNFLPPNPDQEFPPYEPLYNFMNPLSILDGVLTLSFFSFSKDRVVPFLYLKYLFLKCFSHFGFTVSGEILDDPDFNKIIILNYQSVFWGVWDSGGTQPIAFDPVAINLTNHVPKNYSVTRFLNNIANFFGFAYHFDLIKKHCQLVKLNALLTASDRKDYSAQCGPVIKSEFRKQQRRYGVKLNFDPADTTISKPDLTKVERLPDILKLADLEPASPLNVSKVVLVTTLNWFYINKYDEDAKVYRWEYLAGNIYDYEPDGQTDSIETAITPVNSVLRDWRRMGDGASVQALFPHVEQTGNWHGKTGEYAGWEMRILFYHGMQPDVSASDRLYPFACSHNFNSRGEQVGNYSLSLNGTSGVINKFWTRWLAALNSYEVVTFVLNLSLIEYINLNWTDVILIRSVMYLQSQQTSTSPFLARSRNDYGTLTVQALRIAGDTQAHLSCTAAVGNVAVTYVSGGTATVDFVETLPGAGRWQYAIDGGTAITVNSHPFTIPAVPGTHSIVVTPLCGINPNPSGSATVQYEIPGKKVTITLSAELTQGREHNKMVLTAVASEAPVDILGSWDFEFGQCTLTTSTGVTLCQGFIPYFGDGANMQFVVGTTSVVRESVGDTPAADAGKITLVRVSMINSPNVQLEFVKAPGQTWTLSYS